MSHLGLEHFLLRAQALKLYRNVLRTARAAPARDQNDIVSFARSSFETHKHIPEHDLDARKAALDSGLKQYEALTKTLSLASGRWL